MSPWCLAIMKDGHFVIGFYYDNQISVYTEDGAVVWTIQIERPDHISVCQNTGDIHVAVVCEYSELCVVDQELVTKYQYGDICTDVVFDSFGHLLVSELEGVHVLTADTGKHIKTVETGSFGNNFRVSSLIINIYVMMDNLL